MKTKNWIILLSITLFTMTQVSVADEDNDDDNDRYEKSEKPYPGVAVVKNPFYSSECGACHFAYQPGLLPARSWDKLISNLENHFGENAELNPEDTRTIKIYLMENAADKSSYRHSRKFIKSLKKDQAPLRITEIPYFRREHRKIPARLVKDNDKVKSLSNCNACHTRAQEGSFKEGQINIPGHGRWDD